MTATLDPLPPQAQASPRLLIIDIYARLSKDEDGKLEKTERQIADCVALVEKTPGWCVGAVLCDDSLSAWRRNVRRPDWDKLVSRLRNRESDGVMVWHSDRLTRQPRDLETLIDIGERNGLVVASCYGSYDVSKGEDRLMMRVHAAVAEKSSADASRRIRRKFEGQREAGELDSYGGPRKFGFPGAGVTDEHVARERAALQLAAEDFVNGRTLAAITRDWNEAGLPTMAGAAEWKAVTVRQVLMRPRNAGLIVHNGAVVNRAPDEAVYGEELHDRVMSLFASRRRGRPASGKHLGTGYLECRECGRSLNVRTSGNYSDGARRVQYQCPPASGGCGKVVIDGRGADAWLAEFAIQRLSDPRHAEALARQVSGARERRAEIAALIKSAEETQEALADRLGRGEITMAVFDAAMRPQSDRVKALRAEDDELRGATPRSAGMPADQSVFSRWHEGDVEDRRMMLADALTWHRIVVRRASGRSFDPDRISAKPR